jgi:hypothetical protein
VHYMLKKKTLWPFEAAAKEVQKDQQK